MELTRQEDEYMIKDGSEEKTFSTIDDLFRYLLCRFEGRSPLFAGEESYGCVRIIRNPPAVYPLRK